MHTMLIAGIDESLMRSIRSRAALHDRTPEEEALAILEGVAHRPGWRSFGEALMSMPDVGLDSDFAREN